MCILKLHFINVCVCVCADIYPHTEENASIKTKITFSKIFWWNILWIFSINSVMQNSVWEIKEINRIMAIKTFHIHIWWRKYWLVIIQKLTYMFFIFFCTYCVHFRVTWKSLLPIWNFDLFCFICVSADIAKNHGKKR